MFRRRFLVGVKFYYTAIKIPQILILTQPCVHTSLTPAKSGQFTMTFVVINTGGSEYLPEVVAQCTSTLRCIEHCNSAKSNFCTEIFKLTFGKFNEPNKHGSAQFAQTVVPFQVLYFYINLGASSGWKPVVM